MNSKENLKNGLMPSQLYDSTKAIFLTESKQICINIVIKPNARKNEITEIKPNYFAIDINAPPVSGEANKELIKYISGILNIKHYEFIVEKGMINRNKVLALSKSASSAIKVENLKQLLQKESKNFNHSQMRITNFFKI